MPFISLLLMQVFGCRIRESGREEPPRAVLTDRRFSRMVLVYLFCSAMIILYVLPIHADFWVVDDGRPVNHLDVLQPDEVVNAGVVLYLLTPICIRSRLCSDVGLLDLLQSAGPFRPRRRGPQRGNCRNLSVLLGLAWSIAAVVP